MNGLLASGILDKIELPAYIYNVNKLEEQICKVKQSFDLFHILYSIKSNPNEDLMKIMLGKGLGFDAASAEEVDLAIKCGANPLDIYFSCPGKTRRSIISSYGKCNLIADSTGELLRINALAKSLGTVVDVGVRLNIRNEQIRNSNKEIMAGIPTKFGIDFDCIDIDAIRKLHNIRIVGIHSYFGSQLLDPELIYINFAITASAAVELKQFFPIRYVNFGGGFGVCYSFKDSELDIFATAKKVQENKDIQLLFSNDIKLNLELGRYLVAEAGAFASIVVDIKENAGKQFVIIDGGMNTFFRPIFTGELHELVQIEKRTGRKEKYTIVGNLCTPIDQYYEDYLLSPLQENDILIFKNAGAYGLSMSLALFIRRNPIPEYIYRW